MTALLNLRVCEVSQQAFVPGPPTKAYATIRPFFYATTLGTIEKKCCHVGTPYRKPVRVDFTHPDLCPKRITIGAGRYLGGQEIHFDFRA